MQFSAQSEPLTRDIAALNRQALDLVARYGSSNPEDVCLRLNVSQSFMKAVLGLSSESLAELASLGQFLFQPVVEPSVLAACSALNQEQARVHMRSATRLKRQ